MEDIAKQASAAKTPIQQAIDFIPVIENRDGVAQTTALLLFNSDGNAGLVMGQDEELHVTFRQVTA